jgi:hypothetical protein
MKKMVFGLILALTIASVYATTYMNPETAKASGLLLLSTDEPAPEASRLKNPYTTDYAPSRIGLASAPVTRTSAVGSVNKSKQAPSYLTGYNL